MAHLRSCEVRQLLHNKFVVVMGDSVQRAVYKDLVVLLQRDGLLSAGQLKAKGELTFEGDVLLEGGRWGRMHNGTHYREVRQYRAAHHLLRFYFLTRAFSPYAAEVLRELRGGRHAPDLVVLNSCLWDLSRYGPDFRRGYRADLGSLFALLGRALPAPCLRVWNTAMPVAEAVTGGFLLPEQRPRRAARLRLDVLEANFYSAAEAGRHGLDVLDLHFHFRHAARHRLRDGVHWDPRAHRRLSQLLLAHVADAWGVDLPRRRPVGRWLREGAGGDDEDHLGDEDDHLEGPAAAAGARSHSHHHHHHHHHQHHHHQRDSSRGDAPAPPAACAPRSSASASFPRAPRRPSPLAQPRPLPPAYGGGGGGGSGGQSAFAPPPRAPQPRQPHQRGPSTLQVEYTFESSSRRGLQHRLGPVRRVSIRPQSRASPPYPPPQQQQHFGRPRRQQQRRQRHSQGPGLERPAEED